MPFFSVVIPLYNKEGYIRKTLESIVNQTFKDFEIIIVNDGSTDNSLDIAKSFTDSRTTLLTQENSGLSATRNLGIERASGKHIAFIDADDTWLPHHLDQLHKLILDYPEMGMYCSGYTQQRSADLFHRAMFNGLPEGFRGVVPDFFVNSLQNCVAWIGAICIPKKVFDQIGMFDLGIYSEQDTDLYIRIALENPVALDDSSVTAIYNRTDEQSMSRGFSNRKIPEFFHSYKKVEIQNQSLKRYLDVNRFSYGIFLKMADRSADSKSLLNTIDQKHLNRWQRLLLKLPAPIVRFAYAVKKRFMLNSNPVFKSS